MVDGPEEAVHTPATVTVQGSPAPTPGAVVQRMTVLGV